jgi:hypothetical protein
MAAILNPRTVGICCTFTERNDANLELDNSVVLVRQPTTPTERPLLVGEVSAKFCE